MTITDPVLALVKAFHDRGVRFVGIGVWSANLYGHDTGTLFGTEDCDLFLPLDPANELEAWTAARTAGFALEAAGEPLGEPLDRLLAERVIERRALVSAISPDRYRVDLSLVMSGYTFDQVWASRREFELEGTSIPAAALEHIVRSKALAGRPKDRLFLATHAEALRRATGHDLEPDE